MAGKTELDPGKFNSASGVITDTLKDSLASKLKQGQLDDIVSLFGKSGGSSSIANHMVTETVGNLVSKLGISKGIASQVAGFAVPFIINKLGSFASGAGKANKDGVNDLLGDLLTDSVKDKLLGGLGKKFGF